MDTTPGTEAPKESDFGSLMKLRIARINFGAPKDIVSVAFRSRNGHKYNLMQYAGGLIEMLALISYTTRIYNWC